MAELDSTSEYHQTSLNEGQRYSVRGHLLQKYWLYQAVLSASIVGLVQLLHHGGGAFHSFQREEFHIVGWAIGANLLIAAIISYCGSRKGWTNNLPVLLAVDAIISMLPLALAIFGHYVISQHAVHRYGFLLALFLFGKCAVCTLFACSNVASPTRDASQRWFLFATSFVIFATFAPWYTLATIPQGDESHYLLLTYSLLHDDDFYLLNNYEHEDYVEQFPPPMPGLDRWYPYASQERDFLHGVSQEPHLVANSRGEKMLWHDVGMPILLIPGYALGKRLGAEITLALFAATLPAAFLEISLLLGASIVPAIVTAMVFAFSPPLYCYSETIFPELFGAVGMIWVAVFFLRYRARPRNSLVFASGVVIALMPWICMRFWVLAGPMFVVFTAYIIQRRWPSWVAAVKEIAMLGVASLWSLAVFAWFDHKYFDTYLPNAGYLLLQKQMPQFFNRPDLAVLGMLWDRAYGLLPTAPLYIAAAAGVVVLYLRRNFWAAAALSFPCLAYIGFLSFSQYWAGGWTPPARYICSGVALMAPAAALVLTRKSVRFFAALGIWTGLIDLIYVLDPFNRWPSVFHIYIYSALMEYLHDRIQIFSLYSPLSIFPVMRDPRPQDYVVGYVWVLISAITLIWLVKLTRPELAKQRRRILEQKIRHI